ncbi:MAG: hypothetical protein IPN73_01990 [Saprospiraceae bacterium]|nr:hypothetical protein [Saprospiraceae bacterium]
MYKKSQKCKYCNNPIPKVDYDKHIKKCLKKNRNSKNLRTTTINSKNKKKRFVSNSYTTLSLESILKKGDTIEKTLVDPSRILNPKVKIDDLIFDADFLSYNKYTSGPELKKIGVLKIFNELKKEFKEKYDPLTHETKLRIDSKKNEILWSKEIIETINLFNALYKEYYTKRCDICNGDISKNDFDNHKMNCQQIEIPNKEEIENPIFQKQNKLNIKTPHTSKKTTKKSVIDVSGIDYVCQSISDQRTYEKNCKFQTVGRILGYTADKKSKLWWVFNDNPIKPEERKDLKNNTTQSITNRDLARLKEKNSTPISKNNKLVGDILLNKQRIFIANGVKINLLNKATYYPDLDGITKFISLTTFKKGNDIYSPDLNTLFRVIKKIKSEDPTINDSNLPKAIIAKLNKSSIYENINVKPFIRKSFELKSLGILKERQEEIKRKQLASDTVMIIDGPPGTGKTTTLIQRIRFLTSEEAIYSYNLYSDETKKEMVDTKNWILYCPSQTLSNFLFKNIENEGMNTLKDNICVWPEKLIELKNDYHLNNLKINNNTRLNFTETPGFYNEVKTKLNSLLIAKLNQKSKAAFNLSKYKTLSSKIEIEKKILGNQIQLLNLLKTLKEFPKEIKNEIKAVRKEKYLMFNELKQNIIRSISPDQIHLITKNIFGVSISNSFDQIEIERKLIKLISSIINKNLKQISGLSPKYTAVEKQLVNSGIMDIYQNTLKIIHEADKFIENYGIFQHSIDKIVLDPIVNFYYQARKSLTKNTGQKKNSLNDKFLNSNEIPLLISLINEYVILLKSNKLPNSQSKNKYFNAYEKHTKTIIAVDEAPDLSLVDLKCIYSFRNQNVSSVLFCGDMLQKNTNHGLKNWSQLTEVGIPYNLEKLDTTFRQSQTLLECTLPIYNRLNGVSIRYNTQFKKYANEPKPLLFVASDLNARIDWIKDRLIDIHSAYGKELPSTAIIVNTSVQANIVLQRLKMLDFNLNVNIYNESLKNKDLTKKALIFTLDQIKGVEFEAALFLDLGELSENDKIHTELRMQYLYMAMTRAAFYLGITQPHPFNRELDFLNNVFETNSSNWL